MTLIDTQAQEMWAAVLKAVRDRHPDKNARDSYAYADALVIKAGEALGTQYIKDTIPETVACILGYDEEGKDCPSGNGWCKMAGCMGAAGCMVGMGMV